MGQVVPTTHLLIQNVINSSAHARNRAPKIQAPIVLKPVEAFCTTAKYLKIFRVSRLGGWLLRGHRPPSELKLTSYDEVDVIQIGYTSLSNHGRLAGCGSREEIFSNHRGVDLLTLIDPSGLWHEELLHLTAQTDDHEDFLGRRIVGGDSRLVASFPFPCLERT